MQFCLPIRFVFDIRTRGIVVLGSIESGVVRVGDEVEVISRSNKVTARVAGIERFGEPVLNMASAGPEDTGILLEGISCTQVHAGDLLMGKDR